MAVKGIKNPKIGKGPKGFKPRTPTQSKSSNIQAMIVDGFMAMAAIFMAFLPKVTVYAQQLIVLCQVAFFGSLGALAVLWEIVRC